MAFLVYLLTNRITGKKYVGVTTLSIEERFREHVHTAKKPGETTRVISLSIRKHGAGAFDMEELAVACSEDEMFALEQQFVDQHRTLIPHGYNMTAGGDGCPGYKRTPEMRKRLSDANKGKKANQNQLRGLAQSSASKGRRVEVWNIDDPGNRMVFDSTTEAATFCGVSHASICHWANDGRPSRSGWTARYLDPSPKKMAPRKVFVPKKRDPSRWLNKSVKLIRVDGTEVASFPSMNAAAAHIGVHPSSLSNILAGRNKQVKGYIPILV